jgi:DNA-binding SARP family transcriptional activator
VAGGEKPTSAASRAPAVRINLLGPDLLSVDGRVARPGGPGQRALLIRLALAGGRLVTADRLVEDLWGDAASDAIVSTLQGYISRLRSVLGDASRVRRSGPGYILDVSAEEVDARAFEALLGEGRRLLPHDPAAAETALAEALALWRGPALSEVSGYDWGATAAAHLDGLRLVAIESRFDALLASGRHESAVADIRQAVDAHPLHERFVAQLMVALYRCGRQTEALREYEQARRRLVDELGLDPSPDLARHEAAILGHEPWLAAPRTADGATVPRPRETADAPPGEQPAAVATPSGSVDEASGSELPQSRGPFPPVLLQHADRPFVGREAELARLREAWRQSCAGDRRLVVVEGEAGIGKTRLAARFATEMQDDAAVLFGRSTSDNIIPYEPFVEVLRGILRRLPPERRERFVAMYPAVRAFVPLLGDLAPSDTVPAPAETPADRYLVFETIAELAATMSQRWPLLFVIDDLQWADALTVRMLAHLLAHERPIRLMVIGTVRSVPRFTNLALDELLGGLAPHDAIVRVPLGGLDERQVAALLDAAGATSEPSVAASVARATGGNAFFVTELAEQAGTAGTNGSLPLSVRDRLIVRLGLLGDDAKRLVRTAAVAGAVTSVPVLLSASGLGEAEFVDAVDELLEHGFFVEEDDIVAGRNAVDRQTPFLAFRHAIIRQVVEDHLALVRRRAIHARLAEAYAHVEGEALRHAHHAVEAGDLVGADELAEAAISAGREALAVVAAEEAIGWGERALARGDRVSVPHRCAALLLLSDAHRAVGDRVTARTFAGAAAELARELADPTWLAAAAEAVALSVVGVGFDFGVGDEQVDELLREALVRLPAGDVDQRSRLLAASMSSAAATGDLYALRGLSEEALALAERHGQHALVATAHLATRMSVWRIHTLDQRLRTDLAAHAAAAASGRLHLQLNAMLYLVSDLFEAGRVAESNAWFARLRSLAAEVRQPVYDAFVDFFDARTALLEGRYEDATKLADRGLEVGQQSHGANAEQAWAGVTFLRAWDEGRLHSLVDVVSDAGRAAPQFPIWRVAYAATTLAGGRRDEPAAVLAELVTGGRLVHNPDSLWFTSASLLTEIARSLADAERAAVLLRELEPCTGRMTVTGLGRASLGPVDRYIGVAALTAGDFDRADAHLGRAVEQARDVGAAPHVARALADRAVTRSLRAGPGDDASAERLLAEAVGIADRLGLVLGPIGGPSPTASSSVTVRGQQRPVPP